jgi:putative ABC transport system ATP-binding protein
MSLLAFERVSRHYGSGEALVKALDDVSFSVDRGEFVAIVGASGSGKSTALSILGGLDRPTGGRFLFQGVDVGALDRDGLALYRRHYVGFVFQGFQLIARTSALDNVALPLIYQRIPASERRRRALAALAEVGLADRAGHTPSELSGGQQQRVAIARALVTAPSLLLADEPTGNLDTARKAEIMDLLRTLNRAHGLTVLLVTHDPHDCATASRVITLRDGRVLSDVAQAAA